MENIVQEKKNKQIKNKEYISYLHDEVMLHIFCLLRFKTLILASLVLKWESIVRSLLAMIPSSINFDEIEMATRIKDTSKCITSVRRICRKPLQNSEHTAISNFSKFVDRTLHLHTDYIIKKLRFGLCYHGQSLYKERIDKWVQFTMTHQIKEIELNLSVGRSIGYPPSYELPHGHFASKLLEHMTLNFCILRRCCLGVFGSLQSLYFKDVNVLDILLEELVSKCPMLEDLTLECCNVPYQFMVCTRDMMVKNLSVIRCYTNGWLTCRLDVSTPELLILNLTDCHLLRHRIKYASKLTSLVIEINQRIAINEEQESLDLLLQGLSHCQTLSLNFWCIQVLSFRVYFLQQSITIFYNLKHLVLKVGLHKTDFPGVAYMMRNCRILESLTIFIQKPTPIKLVLRSLTFIDEDNYWHSQSSSFYFLKEVTIYGFSYKSNEKQMVLFLLRNARVLRNMSIYLSQENSDHDNSTELSMCGIRSGAKITFYKEYMKSSMGTGSLRIAYLI